MVCVPDSEHEGAEVAAVEDGVWAATQYVPEARASDAVTIVRDGDGAVIHVDPADPSAAFVLTVGAERVRQLGATLGLGRSRARAAGLSETAPGPADAVGGVNRAGSSGRDAIAALCSGRYRDAKREVAVAMAELQVAALRINALIASDTSDR